MAFALSLRTALMSRNEEPEVGDLIEIFRVMYQHWAIYVGKGYVIHFAPPSEVALFHDRACVKKEKLSDVAGNDEYRVNNYLDDEYEPQDIELIVKEAHRLVGEEMFYGLCSNNCEHFVTELRYGKPTSRQVRQVAVGAATTVAIVGFLLIARALLSDSKKEKKNKY